MKIYLKKPANLGTVLEIVKEDAKKYNLVFAGDVNKGRGSGYGCEGTYTADDKHVILDVKKSRLS